MSFKTSIITAIAALSLVACGSSNSEGGFGATEGAGGQGEGGQGQGAFAGSSAGGRDQDGGGVIFKDADIPSSDGSAPPSDGGTCMAQSVGAEPYPLDMYVMMDQSGSMKNQVGAFNAKTQWDAVVEAFDGFLKHNTSKGLGMGIQYFPLHVTPWDQLAHCDKNNPCSNGGACMSVQGGRCFPKCITASDCKPNTECIASGSSGSYCSNTSCNAADYAKPEVEIGPLPQNNSKLLASLKAHSPTTVTPTVPALQGAIDHARQWALQHKDHKVIVVLATDGEPTVCSANETNDKLVRKVKQVAQAGVNGTPSIKTFVIGVINPLDIVSKGNLNQMAAAGGTGQALIVDPNQDMTKAFEQALMIIRGAAMKCEFKVPNDPNLDYHQVNMVYHSVKGEKATVYYVGDPSKCDPKLGGWYYDTPDPDKQKPTKMILCKQSCDFMQAVGGTIDIEIGCQTITAPK